MSDEESFVILGSSPMGSLEADGVNECSPATQSPASLESDTPGSNFTSLKESQLEDLQSARETTIRTPEPVLETLESLTKQTSTETQMLSSFSKSIQTESCQEKSMTSVTSELSAESKMLSRRPSGSKSTDEELSFSIQDCAIKPPLNTSKRQEKEDSNVNATSLASSFIMGEINADVLKTSVYSQFPSISMQSSAEEVVKLQNVVTENIQLKSILEKVNTTMRFFHNSSLQWQEKMNNMEANHKQKLDDCQKEIETLRKENQTLQHNLNSQIAALEIARQKDHEETVQKLSEKSSLVENMRAEIIKLEKYQLTYKDKSKDGSGQFHISYDEHERKIKDLERQLSELYASNLDLKEVEKQYIDELNCLKVNLAAAEELINDNRATIAQLQAEDKLKLEMIRKLEKTSAEQNERILLLEQQTEVYRKDFEMEQEGHGVVVKEKQHILQDLKNLQKRNQELIEEHQRLLNNYEKRLQSAGTNLSFTSAAAAAQTYVNNPQRPIRVSSNLPSASAESQPVATNDALHSCPICNKPFKSLSVLQSHVNDCIDRN